MDEALEKLRYPIGKFDIPDTISVSQRKTWIGTINSFYKQIYGLTSNLSVAEKQLTYRPGGWRIKQVVHHCADSHMNSLIRFKLALTENNPTIKPYVEERWANLADGDDDNLTWSLNLIEAVHTKWVQLLNSMEENDWQKTFIHPDGFETIALNENLGIYAWHCEHHLAHIRLALQ